MPPAKEKLSTRIKETAEELGFAACGIAKAGHLEAESHIFKDWLNKEYHASMAYMNRNIEKRLNPKILNEWAASVIMVLFNYYPGENDQPTSKYKFSKYAYGQDYHHVIKEKLKGIVDAMEDEIGEISARVFVDSAPVLEKAWARKSGLGWIGKNGCLINKKMGSFFFLGTIITDIELDYNTIESKDHCGSCTHCIDACPNNAIVAPGIVDAGKCISYLSIEHKGELTKTDQLHSWIFGCDICQDVCPWNRFSIATEEPAFKPKKDFLMMTDEQWEQLDKDTFDELFKGTAVERTGYDGLMRNIRHSHLNND
jgi:epoxyqueuosine reductase